VDRYKGVTLSRATFNIYKKKLWLATTEEVSVEVRRKVFQHRPASVKKM